MVWREDIESLAFHPDRHFGRCLVHRLAFRTLIGEDTCATDCQRYFAMHEAAFRQAAAIKIAAKGLASADNFHLNSRDILRALQ